MPLAVPERSEGLLGRLVEVYHRVAADQTGGVGALTRVVTRVVDNLPAPQSWRLK